MKNSIYGVLGMFFFSCASVFAQQAVLSLGGNALTSSGSISYSVGRLVVETVSNSLGSVSPGVQRAFEFQTLSLDNFPEISLQMKTYPNPTRDFIFLLYSSNEQTGSETFELFDLSGRRVRTGALSVGETRISFQGLPATMYLLNVNRDGGIIKTFKVIKN